MTLSEFQDLVLEQGDSLETWSERLQREALELIAASPEAAAVLAEAVRIRRAIKSQGDIKAPAGLKNRIFMAAFSAAPERKPVLQASRRERGSAAKLAATI